MASTLNGYLQQIMRLLNDPVQARFNPDDLKAFINTARGQIAAEGECIKVLATLATVNGTQSYAFSAASGLGAGVQAMIAARMISVTQSSLKVLLTHRPWEWFNAYYVCAAATASGVPTTWAQFGQGQNGSLFFYPTPNAVLTMNIDAVCIPNDLAVDTDAEAIPYPWTDAVRYFAAYLAYTEAQSEKDADRMMGLYQTFMRRARQITTATVLPGEYAGGPGAQIAAQKIPLTGAPQAGGQ